MIEVLKKLQDNNTKQSAQILKLNESVSTIYKKVESTDSTINRLYKEQVRANRAREAAEKRAAADAKRRSADNPLQRMAENQKKEQKKGNDLLSKILAALAGLGALAGGASAIFEKVKEGLINTLRNALENVFGKDGLIRRALSKIFGKDGFIRKTLGKIFGQDGFLRKSLGRIFGKDGFVRKSLGKLFGKDSFIRKSLGKVFGKEGFLRKGIGKIFGPKGFLRTQIGKAFSKLFDLLPKGLKIFTKSAGTIVKGAGGVLAKGVGGLAKGAGTIVKGAGGVLTKGVGGLAKGAGGVLAKGVGGLANLALKRGPLAALFAGGDELLSGGSLGRASARGGGAATGAVVGGALGSVVPVVGNLIGAALGSALGDFLGGFLYDKFPEIFKPLDEFGVQIGQKFTEIKDGFTNWWSGVSKKFTEIKDGVADWWKSVTTSFNNIKETIASIPDSIGKFIGDLGKSIKETFTEKLIKPLQSGFENIKKLFNNVKKIATLIGSIISKLNPVNAVKSALGLQEGGPVYLQKGGPMTVPGAGSGDKVPMLLPTGSFVLNRNASQRLQYGGAVLEPGETVWPTTTSGLQALNRNIPRFQSGGEVFHKETGEGYNPNNAKDYKGRPVILSKDAASSFSKMMSAGGINPKDVTSSQRSVSYNEEVGGVANSNHLSGNALDIHGGSKTWLRSGNDEKYGWKWLDYSGHDGHFDYVKGASSNAPVKEGKEDKEKGNKEGKGGGLFGGPFGALTSSLGWLGNLLGLGKFGESFKEGYLEGAKPGGLAMQLFDSFMSQTQTTEDKTSFGGEDKGQKNNTPFKATGNWGPVLKLIAEAESGSGGYEAMYPSTTLPGATKMTIAEVARKANGAVGMWQNLPGYLNERARAVGLDPKTALYNEENQRLIAEYLIGPGQANVTLDMVKDDPEEAMLRLSKVWAAIPKNNSGVSYYAGVGNNKAHIKPSEMYEAFLELQKNNTIDKKQKDGSFGEGTYGKGRPSDKKKSWTDITSIFTKSMSPDKKQEGGMISSMTPVLVEPGEKIFSPGTWGNDISSLNKSVPRFQNGGTVGMKGPETRNDWIDSSMTQSSQPSIIIVNTPSSGGSAPIVSADPGITTPVIPPMSSGPTSPVASLLLTQTYLMADRIG